MSGGKRHNQSSYRRKLAKDADRRRVHTDKYASGKQEPRPSTESDHERR